MTDPTASFYERYWRDGDHAIPRTDPTIGLRMAHLRRLAGDGAGKRALDIGCGGGIFSAALHEMKYQTLGVDLSSNAVAFAANEYPDVEFRACGPDGAIPAEDNTFDMVWCSEVIEHVFDVFAFLSEINRVTKPGGRLLLTTPYHGLIKNTLIALVRFDRHYDPYISHIRFFTPKSLRKCLTDTGFAIQSCQGISRRWPVCQMMLACAAKGRAPGERPFCKG